ncbi:hypothetical protein HYDPIDRAFT_35756 [Hydnomerulius pinastri MD-312]|nr:hypothetical protein HYDPIDRAFT_35756 [Hydnomerulius pinastri MD-312]
MESGKTLLMPSPSHMYQPATYPLQLESSHWSSHSSPRKPADTAVLILANQPDNHSPMQNVSPASLQAVASSVSPPPYLEIQDMHLSTSGSQTLDLPSWTPLRTSRKCGGTSHSSQSEVDDLLEEASSGKSKQQRRLGRTSSTATRLAKPRNTRRVSNTTSPVSSSVVPQQTSLSKSTTGKVKNARLRFDGVVITSRPFSRNSTSVVVSAPPLASTAAAFSLVDALQRTFNANKHPEAPLTSVPPRPLDQVDDASNVPQTEDVETVTEPEDEPPRFDNHLLAPGSPLKRRLTRATASDLFPSAPESTSDDNTPVPQRKPRRAKVISYDTNAALVDDALGTRLAPVDWGAEPDFVLEDMDSIGEWDTARPEVGTDDEYGEEAATAGVVIPPVQLAKPRTLSTVPGKVEPSAVRMPYLSRGAKFRQQLDLSFGENATVRVDRGAHPKLAVHNLFALGAPSKEPSPAPSQSTASASRSVSARTTSVSFDSSTQPTSQSPEPEVHGVSTARVVSGKRQLSRAPEASGPAKKPKVEISEDQVGEWVVALQRLIKGKVRVTEEDLDMLSIILAEIESVAGDLDKELPTTTELYDTVKQLSELQDIPFHDANHLRRRAESIIFT